MNYLGYLGISDLCLLSSASRITELGLSSRAPKASRHPGSSGVCSPGTQLFSSSVFLSSFYRSSANIFLALNYLWHGYWINKTFSRAWDLWVEIFKNNLWEMKQNKASHLLNEIAWMLESPLISMPKKKKRTSGVLNYGCQILWDPGI